jgi:hypothetical protein
MRNVVNAAGIGGAMLLGLPPIQGIHGAPVSESLYALLAIFGFTLVAFWAANAR